MNRKSSLIFIIIFISIFVTVLYSYRYKNMYISSDDFNIENSNGLQTTTKSSNKYTEIILNAAGDCTIGYDENFGYSKSFNEVASLNGYEFFFENVKDIFDNDDITLVNLEGTFTESTVRRERKFNFKAPLDYVNILKSGSVEIVNIANNHIYDYNEVGYDDTIKTLSDANINYFGFEEYYVYSKDNINIGFAGIYCIEDMNCTKKIDKAINELQNKNVDTIILSFHWGIERSYKQSYIQTYLAHYAIDNGVELVLGHHPHVLQGIELYKDKYIVYSLANFSFGGNKNPKDKDSMIFQIKFKYKNNEIESSIVKVIPVSVSSEKNINNYQPTPVIDEEYTRIMNKIQENSIGITFS